MVKNVFNKNTVEEQYVLLSNLLEGQRKIKKILLTYLEKVSEHISNTDNSEYSEALVSCLSNVQSLFDNIKLNIDKLIELKLFIDNISNSNSLNIIDFEKYKNQFIDLTEKINSTNMSYNTFMENLTAIPAIDFSNLEYEKIDIPTTLENIENELYETTNSNENKEEIITENTENEISEISGTNNSTNITEEITENNTENTMVENSEKSVSIEETTSKNTEFENSETSETNNSTNVSEEIIENNTEDAISENSEKSVSIEETTSKNTEFENSETSETNNSTNVSEEIIENNTEDAISENSEETTETNTENTIVENSEETVIIEESASENIENEISKMPETSNSDESNKTNFIEKTLLINYKTDIAILPYSLFDLEEYFSENPEKYSSISDIIEKEYTVSLKDYKNNSISRFKETFKLARDKNHFSFFEALNYANKLKSETEVEPIIIAACESVHELDCYLECLYNDSITSFNCFNIITN